MAPLNWISRNHAILEGISAAITALAALAAVVFIPWQISQSDRIQREQAAREIYREFLNITMQRADLASAAFCALGSAKDRAGYEAYVEYLLYTAEQVMTLDSAAWQDSIRLRLAPHLQYLCTFQEDDLASMTDDVSALVQALQTECPRISTCDAVAP